ncbi:unnamed protein product, partial [Didymodactylos carnosus]
VNTIEATDWPVYVTSYLENGQLTTDDELSDEVKRKIQQESHMFIIDPSNDVLRRKLDDETTVSFVPFINRFDTVRKSHEAYGHIATEGTYQLLRTRAWWPNMKQDVKKWVSMCQKCQLPTPTSGNHEELHPLTPVPAFHRWSLDFVGPLPKTGSQNCWLLTAIDHATKWPVVKAVPNATTQTVAKFLHDEIMMNYGCPSELLTDRGPSTMSRELRTYLQTMGTKHLLTSAYHPQTNGTVERFNRTFISMLRKYIQGKTTKWDEFVDQALFACRVRVHQSTGRTPFFMVYGVEPKIPGDELTPILDDRGNTTINTTSRLNQLHNLAVERERVTTKLKENAIKMKIQYDKHVKHTNQLKTNDWVLVKHEQRKKMHPYWLGPFKIRKVFSLGTFQLEDVSGQIKPDLVHRNRLKLALHATTPETR